MKTSLQKIISRAMVFILLYTGAVIFVKPPPPPTNNRINSEASYKQNVRSQTLIDSLMYTSQLTQQDEIKLDNLMPVMYYDGDQLLSIYILKKGNKEITLIPVQHFAELDYYRTIEKRFLQQSDFVLYEYIKLNKDCFNLKLFTTKNTLEYRLGLAEVMGLESQIHYFNYKHLPNNWIHADLTLSTCSQKFLNEFNPDEDLGFSLFMRYLVVPFLKSQKFWYTIFKKKTEYEASYRYFLMPPIDYIEAEPTSIDLEREDTLFHKLDELLSLNDTLNLSIIYGYNHSYRILERLIYKYKFKPVKKYKLISCRISTLLSSNN